MSVCLSVWPQGVSAEGGGVCESIRGSRNIQSRELKLVHNATATA